jgi:hypothetical protein
MAKVLGFNKTGNDDYFELLQRAELQQKLITDLIKLNEAYEAEVKRLVGEYDIVYQNYLDAIAILQKYDPHNFGYPKFLNKDLIKIRASNRNIEGVEFIDFSKPKADE